MGNFAPIKTVLTVLFIEYRGYSGIFVVLHNLPLYDPQRSTKEQWFADRMVNVGISNQVKCISLP